MQTTGTHDTAADRGQWRGSLPGPTPGPGRVCLAPRSDHSRTGDHVNPGARIVGLGKQGAGKGTQAVRLSRHYVVPHISTGDTFRAAVRSGSEFGQLAKQYLDAGDLVPDEVVIGVVRERLTHADTSHRGFILDGFPRTVAQAEALFEILAPRSLDLVLDLEIDTSHVLRRLASRRVCSDCGANYSVPDNPPRVPRI